MNNTEVHPTHQTTINNLLKPVIDTSFVDTKPVFPSLYWLTGQIYPVNNQAEKREPKINIAKSLQKTFPEHRSALDLGMGHQPNCNPLEDESANPYDYEDFLEASQPPAPFANVGVPSTHHTFTQHVTNSHTAVSKPLSGASTPFTSLAFGATNTNLTSHYPAYPIAA